ncbi:MAG TPA: hypothetical protein VNW46_15870 [Gemmatimonadaceae bacterium]|nr:hypothetical protein [Gemmatimonadaceae bacterium]
MQLSRLIAVALVSAACASCASSGGYPSAVGDAPSNISRAKTLIDDATKAGADTLAPDALQSAKAHLAESDAAQKSGAKDKAAMAARLAAADATYARAVAQRVTAERMRSAEQAQLQSLTTGSTP